MVLWVGIAFVHWISRGAKEKESSSRSLIVNCFCFTSVGARKSAKALDSPKCGEGDRKEVFMQVSKLGIVFSSSIFL